jgi:hypothetical protein
VKGLPKLGQRLRRLLLRWPGRRRPPVRMQLLTAAAVLGVALLVAISVFAALSWHFGDEDGWWGVDKDCNNNQFSCGVLVEIVPTVLTLGVTFVLFIYWRVRQVARKHLSGALKEPWRLVPTATEMPEVVGRDGICAIIQRDLRYSAGRRAQIIVGGIGEGKTAVLVRLTQELARNGAVPVPVQLSEAGYSLDFLEMAKDRFLTRADVGLLTEDEGDKVWRRLRRDDRIVVLADGLEEALQGSDGRAAAIRRAVDEARDRKLPLVIASRPDEALRGLGAALIRLEPLSERATVECLRQGGKRGADEARRLAEVAKLSESPLFLDLARKLNGPHGLTGVCTDKGRVAARVEVLERWRDAMIKGADHGRRQLSKDRKAAFEGLEAMACMALRAGSLELELDAVRESPFVAPQSTARERPRLVANVGEDMGVVERREGKVRFRHGVIQAYLGARGLVPLVRALDDEASEQGTDGRYLDDEVLRRPSRELLIALAIACCLPEERARGDALSRQLSRGVDKAQGADRFDLLAGAWEIAAAASDGDTGALSDVTVQAWEDRDGSADEDELRLIDAKLRAVARMEEVPTPETYSALWRVCLAEDAYRVRLRAAQAIGSGGSEAHRAIRGEVDSILDDLDPEQAGDRWRTASADDVRRWSLLGWILPSLVASCAESPAEQVVHMRQSLERWVDLACRGLHLGAESCLAQGFKYEANRLPGRSDPATRAILIGHAEKLIASTEWWYSQTSLLQAFGLWVLDSEAAQAARLEVPFGAWTGKQQHPYVRATARLCVKATKPPRGPRRKRAAPTPGHFIWIDEPGVAAKIGSRSAEIDVEAAEGLWISPAAGWHTLAESARQLVAEILIFLNLVEAAEAPTGTSQRPSPDDVVRTRERRRRKIRDRQAWLPPCMVKSGHGGLLAADKPDAPDGDDANPCTCRLDLCPYPARGELLFRGELGETFCREQRRLLGFRRSGIPSWHEWSLNPTNRRRRTIGRFWSSMEDRAQELNAKSLSPES